ncbi:MAG: trigger factor, partial [Clostridia bacterium]|nr:trigger factor [Clostridia bacterium]
MSKENVKEIAANRSELTLKIEKPAFDAAVMQAYKKNAGKINVPGFRRGKAPKSIIEKMYGSSVFYDDAIDSVLPEIYENAVKESGLDVVSRPEIEVVSIDENGVVLTAKVYTRPVAKVAKYIGLTAEKKPVEVTEKEVDDEIMHERKHNSRMLTVTDRAAEAGDIATIDFTGYLNGKKFEGGEAKNHDLVLGSGSFIPGFEEQIVGHNAGENFDITVTFPEEYGEKSLAGKETVFKIALHALKREEIPALDDDFVKEVSEDLNTVDEYKAQIKTKITERKEASAQREFEQKVMDSLAAETEVEIPACMIDDEVENDVRDYDYRLRSQGGSLEMLFKYTGQNEEQLKKMFRPDAERRVKIRLAIDAVVKAENITASAEEIEEEYKKIAEAYKMEAEDVKSRIPEESIREDVVSRKASDVVINSAVAVAPAAEEKEEKPKKT